MPNQRKKGKTRIAVWLTPAQRQALDRVIESGAAKDMSDFVIKAIEAEYKKKHHAGATSNALIAPEPHFTALPRTAPAGQKRTPRIVF